MEPIAPKLTKKNALKAIHDAFIAGDITLEDARVLQGKLGVSSLPSYVPRSKKVEKKLKRKRKLAYASRRRNRGTTKGQKRSGGIRVYTKT